MENKVYIALGTNLGNREENLREALEKLGKIVQTQKKSEILETDPEGYENQGKFLNMVISARTTLNPQELLEELLNIEFEMGRKREIKNGPRIIDLDILLYEDRIINDPNLKIPHPMMHKRRFVLEPLKDIAPEEEHPQLKKTIKTLADELKKN